MFRYIHGGKHHTDTSREHMLNLGMNTATIESVLAQEVYEKEAAWSDVRKKRNKLISVTDYTQVCDSPFSAEKQSEFREYREALRQIPQLFEDIDSINWPTKPE